MNYTYIAIFPNSGDNWTSTSPVTGYNLSGGKTALVFGTLTADSFTNYVRVPSMLMNISSIQKSVDIFSTKSDLADTGIKGLGGIAKISEIEFSLVSSGISVIGLLGRTVKVYIGDGSSLSEAANIVFYGKIFDVNPGSDETIFTARGRLSVWDREIGTITESESDVYKGKIYPIVYGDFSDEYGFLPVVMDKNVRFTPKLWFDAQELKDIAAMYVWDEDSKVSYLANHGSNVQFDGQNRYVELLRYQDNYLVDGCLGSADTIQVWNPCTIAFELDGSPSLDTTSIYTVESDYYQYVEKIDDYYIFTTVEGQLPSTITGTLTKSAGTGPSTVDFTWHSEILARKIELEGQEEEYDGDVTIVNEKPSPCVIVIGDEHLLVTYQVDHLISGVYVYTTFYVSRGFDGTTARSHTAYSPVYFTDKIGSSKWLVKNIFWPTGISIGSILHDTSTPFQDSVILTQDMSMSGLDNLIKPSRENLTLPVTYESYLAQISIDLVGQSEDSKVILLINLEFPKISTNGEIIDTYVIGAYETEIGEDIKAETTPTQAYIGITEGGKPISELDLVNYAYYDGVSMMHLFNGCGKFVKNAITSPDNLWSVVSDSVSSMAMRATANDTESGLNFNNVDTDPNFDEDAYSLRNEYDPTIIDKDGRLTATDEINGKRISIVCFADWGDIPVSGDATITWKIACPGLLVYFYVDPVKTPFYWRGQGRIDGSDNLIEDPVDIISNICEVEAGIDSGDIEATSDRASWINTYVQSDNTKKLSEILETVAQESGLIVTESNAGKLSIKSLDVPATVTNSIANSNILRDDSDQARWSEIYTPISNLITDVTAKYQKRLTDNEYMALATDSYAGAAAILDDDRPVVLNLDTHRDATTVTALLTLMETYYSTPLRVITIYLDPSLYAWEVGDWCTFASETYVYNSSGNKYLIIETELTPPCKDNDISLKLVLLEI
jgi:hypothetical protein